MNHLIFPNFSNLLDRLLINSPATRHYVVSWIASQNWSLYCAAHHKMGWYVSVFFFGETLANAIARTNGRSRGFDYLRIGLSCAVVLWHSFRVSYADFRMDGWLLPTFGLILPMFFALSGFLISGSLIRSRSIHEFVALRAMRILPALAVETLISLVLIGAAMTTLSWHDFFLAPGTRAYLLNIIGWVHLELPGVFRDLPHKRIVNASLWTIPFELECYLLIVFLWMARIIKTRWALLGVAILLQIALPLIDFSRGASITEDMHLPGRVLVLAFLWGVVLFAFREHVRLSVPILAAALGMAMLAMTDTHASYFVGIPAAYVTVYLGMRDPPKIPVVMDGDYSYGIYLYSFPIQQLVTALLPGYRHWYVNFPLALLITAGCSAFSWNFVEKPVLSQRKHWIGGLDRVVDRIRHRRPRPDPAATSVMDEKAHAVEEKRVVL